MGATFDRNSIFSTLQRQHLNAMPYCGRCGHSAAYHCNEEMVPGRCRELHCIPPTDTPCEAYISERGLALFAAFPAIAAADEARRRAEEERARMAEGMGITVKDLSAMMCDGVAALFAANDRSVLQVRGYLVFPGPRLFMEHWWCRTKAGALIDPLSALFRGRVIERAEIDAAPVDETRGVGSFDCLAMAGPCDRVRRGAADPCEWCSLRATLESKGLAPYEIAVAATLRPATKGAPDV